MKYIRRKRDFLLLGGAWLIGIALLCLNGCSNRISRREIEAQTERVRELESRVLADVQKQLSEWEVSETNSIATKYEELNRDELIRFRTLIRQESGFDMEFTTRDEYQKAFYEYVAQQGKEFADFMNEGRYYAIGTEKEEWNNLGTGGAIYLQFVNNEGQWTLLYEGKGISEGKKISVAVYDRNGLFIERCEFTVDGKYERTTRNKTESEYNNDILLAQIQAANATVSYLNISHPTFSDMGSLVWRQTAPSRVSKTVSNAEWHAQDVSGKIMLKSMIGCGNEPTYYSVRVFDPDFSHKMKNGWDWATEGGLL